MDSRECRDGRDPRHHGSDAARHPNRQDECAGGGDRCMSRGHRRPVERRVVAQCSGDDMKRTRPLDDPLRQDLDTLRGGQRQEGDGRVRPATSNNRDGCSRDYRPWGAQLLRPPEPTPLRSVVDESEELALRGSRDVPIAHHQRNLCCRRQEGGGPSRRTRHDVSSNHDRRIPIGDPSGATSTAGCGDLAARAGEVERCTGRMTYLAFRSSTSSWATARSLMFAWDEARTRKAKARSSFIS